MNAEKELTMKIGSRVMCVVNLDMCGSQQIVNGSQGVVENMIGGYLSLDLKMVLLN